MNKDFRSHHFCVILLSSVIGISQPVFAQTIYGLKNAESYKNNAKTNHYIQVASFLNKTKAQNYKQFIARNMSYPIHIKHKNNFYQLVIGPIKSAAAVRHVAIKLRSHSNNVINESAPLKKRSHVVTEESLTHSSNLQPNVSSDNVMRLHERDNWYISLSSGVQYPHLQSNMKINNNSEAPPPFDHDLYTTHNKSQAIIGLAAGHRWEQSRFWFPAYSGELSYQHFFSANIGNEIVQYSQPEFTNYRYSWNLTSDLLMASAKLNLFQSAYNIGPFINAGIGTAFNTANKFNESALAGVTARVSPGFAKHTSTEFAYRIGAGIDYQLNPQVLLAVGYNYQDLGRFASGQGKQTWINQSLGLNSYKASDVYASLSYLFAQ